MLYVGFFLKSAGLIVKGGYPYWDGPIGLLNLQAFKVICANTIMIGKNAKRIGKAKSIIKKENKVNNVSLFVLSIYYISL